MNTPNKKIKNIIEKQRNFFNTGTTQPYKYRCRQLKQLQSALRRYESELCEALWNDLHKSAQEAIMTEISIVNGEIKNHLRNLKEWMKRRKCTTPLKMAPSSSYVITEPLGNTLIISPWNYPVQLLLNPLIGAVSAGCTAILKPSPYVPQVSAVIEKMINEYFEEEYIAVVTGNREVNKELLDNRFDLIFFTGSPALGRKVMEAAAKFLTPVVLELGGKSPCIVDKDADIKIAARRIAWGKTLNAGQTCIAPDYLLIHSSKKEAFVEAFGKEIEQLHGKDIQQSKHFVRMVSDAAFKRVSSYLNDGNIVFGGRAIANERYIEPTLLDNVSTDATIMQEEIFGPLLPMITFEHEEEFVSFIKSREKPLALYYFGNRKKGRKITESIASGGACINDTIMHIANENIPFGGVGNSGMGQYHGYDSYLSFSHRKSVVTTPTWLDLPFRYMPYKMFKLVKKIL